MKMPLEGICVLDLTRLLPGPFATMILGDYGARVIKIESPGEGDYLRWMPPMIREDMSAYYSQLNRNKEHLALDLKQEKGREIFFRLLEKADVLIEGFRPGVTRRWAIDYPSLESSFPQLIYCSLTGYGQEGPYSQKGGHDLNYTALSGVLDLMGPEGGPPSLSGIQIADIGGGALYSIIAIAFALLARNQNGKGQFLDIAMMDGTFSFLPLYLANYFATSQIPRRGSELLCGALGNYNVYEAGDGKYLSLGALEPKFWMAFCQKLGDPELMAINFTTLEGAAEIKERLSKIFLQKSRDQWMAFFEGEDVCLEPVLNLEEALSHPQTQHRKLVDEVDIEGLGLFPQLSPPMKFSSTPGRISSPPKGLGADTEKILKDLGLSSGELEILRKEKVI